MEKLRAHHKLHIGEPLPQLRIFVSDNADTRYPVLSFRMCPELGGRQCLEE